MPIKDRKQVKAGVYEYLGFYLERRGSGRNTEWTVKDYNGTALRTAQGEHPKTLTDATILVDLHFAMARMKRRDDGE